MSATEKPAAATADDLWTCLDCSEWSTTADLDRYKAQQACFADDDFLHRWVRRVPHQPRTSRLRRVLRLFGSAS